MGGDGRTDTATVLFTDLAGSTALRSRLGEEAADELRRRHDALIVAAIVANRGVVVKHLGDGIMATFTGAADALSGAVAVQQAIDGHNRGADEERMSVRIGLSTGDVSFEGEDCFGLPVVEAQRLEAAAEPGQILCAQLVQLMSRGRGGHSFAPVGDLDLKGIDGPVTAVEVVWTPAAVHEEQVRDLPRALSTRGAFDFAGRASEISYLADAYKRAASGRTTVVLISGEPGIGKTRLISELAQRAAADGAVIVAGRSDEHVRVAYRPFVEALRDHLEHHSGRPAAEVLGPRAGELRRLIPDLDNFVADVPATTERDDPEFERFQLLGAIEDWLRLMGAEDPVVLVLDDLHWAEDPTLTALRYLVDELENVPLLVVGTYRDTDLDRTHPLAAALADFRRREDVYRIDLAGLNAEGVQEFLTVAAGHELDEAGTALASAVHRETSGNPFFVGEVLRHLAESGAIVQRDGVWTSDLSLSDVGIPEGIREVVGRRLDRLSDETGKVLAAAAVMGHDFEVGVLASVAGRDIDDVLDSLDEAAAASLVLDDGVDHYRFTHALVRTTLTEELSTTRRSRIHRRVAEELEARHGADLGRVAPRLAHHWAETADPDPTMAVHWALVAAQAALDQAAPDDACRWCESGLELLDPDEPDEAQRAHLLVTRADALLQVADPGWRASAMAGASAAISEGDGALAARALSFNSQTALTRGMPVEHDRIELVERALEIVDADDTLSRLRLLTARGLQHLYAGEADARAAIAHEASSLLADTSHAVDDLMPMVLSLTVVIPHVGDGVDAARGAVADIAERAIADPTSIYHSGAAWYLHNRSIADSDRAGYDQWLARLREIRASRPPQTTLRMLALARIQDHQLDGRLDEVESAMEEFAALSAANPTGAQAYSGLTAYLVARERGRLAELAPLFEAMSTENSPGPTAAVIASGLAGGGQHDAARSLIDEFRPFDDVAEDPGYPVEVCCFADAIALVGDAEAARELEPLVEAITTVQVITGGFAQGAVSWWRARLAATTGEMDRAEGLFGDALRVHDDFGCRAHQARARVDYAEFLIDRGRAAEAVPLAHEVLDLVDGTELEDSRRRGAAIIERWGSRQGAS